MLRFARRFSHVPLFPPPSCAFRVENRPALRFSQPSNIYIMWHFGMPERERPSGKMQTEAKTMPDLEKRRKKETFGTSKEADEEIGNEETGRLNVGKDAVSEAIQDQPAAHTVGSLCESQSVRSSAAVRPQRRLMRMHFFVFLILINQQWDAQKTGCTLKLRWWTKLMKKPEKSSSGCAESC